jgi:hypothetical protein
MWLARIDTSEFDRRVAPGSPLHKPSRKPKSMWNDLREIVRCTVPALGAPPWSLDSLSGAILLILSRLLVPALGFNLNQSADNKLKSSQFSKSPIVGSDCSSSLVFADYSIFYAMFPGTTSRLGDITLCWLSVAWGNTFEPSSVPLPIAA